MIRTPLKLPLIVLFALGVCVPLAALAWHDYNTTVAWQRTSEDLLERRADEAAELLGTAFARDMRGAYDNALATLHPELLYEPGVRTLQYDAAIAFSKYPYIESFIAFRTSRPDEIVIFTRADRRPSWLPAAGPNARTFPVEVRKYVSLPAGLNGLLDTAATTPLTVAQARLADATYQLIAREVPLDEVHPNLHPRPAAVFAFTVNLDWTREHYFPDLVRQVATIAGTEDGLTVAMRDDARHTVVSLGGTTLAQSEKRRSIPILFADPLAVTVHNAGFRPQSWDIAVGIDADRVAPAVFASTKRMVIFTAGAIVALTVGFAMTARAIRARTRLAELRSDFVSTVTHNLKTPIASIRIMGETLARRLSRSDPDSAEYAQLLVQESRQLSRLVENLLAYSRVTDVTDVYTFEPLAVDEIVDRALSGFQNRLVADGFDVSVNIPVDIRDVRADASAIDLVFVNLIDNSIRYSGEQKSLCVEARDEGNAVRVVIRDSGVGIPSDELPHVRRKFYRGSLADSEGSGLGLALADRIIADHGGSWTIASAAGDGTTIEIALPAA